MKLRSMLGPVAAGVLAALAPAAAQAAPWHRITSPGGTNVDQVGLARTPDGVLHVAWPRRSGSTYGVVHTPISAHGKVGSAGSIVSGWSSISNPALVPAPGGALRAFFGGIRTTVPTETNDQLNAAGSSDGGASWALQPGSIVADGTQAYGSPVAATAVGPALTPYEAWAGSLGTWVHAGLTPTTPNVDYQTPLGHYGYDPGIASDASGHVTLAWYSNADGHLGVYAQGVAASGAPVGTARRMPHTGNMQVGMLARTPIVARPGGGVYVAYPTGYPSLDRVRLWRVGAGGSTRIARTKGDAATTVAAGADGRLWVAWTDTHDGTTRLLARRSNPAGTVFGATVDAGRPKGSASAYRLDASVAGNGSLDAFASFARRSAAGVATWYRRIKPGLTVELKPAKVHRGVEAAVHVAVADAGAPVAHAKVKVGGVAGKTSKSGKVTLHVVAGQAHKLKAVVTHKGYTRASAKLRVVR